MKVTGEILLVVVVVVAVCVHAVPVKPPLANKGPLIYHGMYKGKCSNDGFYYNDKKSFIICSNGNSYVQHCAPGTVNSKRDHYQGFYGKKKTVGIFCDVNLNDYRKNIVPLHHPVPKPPKPVMHVKPVVHMKPPVHAKPVPMKPHPVVHMKPPVHAKPVPMKPHPVKPVLHHMKPMPPVHKPVYGVPMYPGHHGHGPHFPDAYGPITNEVLVPAPHMHNVYPVKQGYAFDVKGHGFHGGVYGHKGPKFAVAHGVAYKYGPLGGRTHGGGRDGVYY